MGNRFKSDEPEKRIAPIILNTDFDKRAFCHDMNFRNDWARNVSRWHYVEPATKDHPSSLTIAQGTTADEVWMTLDGKKIDYVNWTKEKLDAATRRARWLIGQGKLSPGEMQEAAE